MKQDLPVVSVIVPCYNMQDKIPRFLESIAEQTYKNLELVFIDDGSVDGTKECIKGYFSRYRNAGMICKYIYQENSGLGASINKGLKNVTGDYLVWPDPDDWLACDSIEKKVVFMENNKEYSIVTSNAYVFSSENLKKPQKLIIEKVNKNVLNENQFELLLNRKSLFCPGCHMIRMRDLKKVNPTLDIFEAKRGQNFQLLMPILYGNKRYFLDEPLYNYVIYKDSMSRGDNTYEKRIIRTDEIYEIIIETLNRMMLTESEYNKYLRVVDAYDANLRFKLAFKYGDVTSLNREYYRIKNIKKVNLKYIVLRKIGNKKLLHRIAMQIYYKIYSS